MSILKTIAASINKPTGAAPTPLRKAKADPVITARKKFINSLQGQIEGIDILLSGEQWLDKCGKRAAKKWFIEDKATGTYGASFKYGRTNFVELCGTDAKGNPDYILNLSLEDVKDVYQKAIVMTEAGELDEALKSRVAAISKTMNVVA